MFSEILSQYEASFRQHGNSPAALLTPKGKQALRFQTLLPVLTQPGMSILDYGCGLGHLLDYLNTHVPYPFAYRGVDMVKPFIDHCQVHHHHAHAGFDWVDPAAPVQVKADVVFASGVFNLLLDGGTEPTRLYMEGRLAELFAAAGHCLVVDFLSEFVDYSQSAAYHPPVGRLLQFVMAQLSRRVVLRHDLLPYEYSLLIFKDQAINRPDNAYVSPLKWNGHG
jgi:hypothetical protein